MALKDNLISVWELDEASGNAIDSHGSNDLTETSGTIGASTGPAGLNGSRDFEASDSELFLRSDNAGLSAGDVDFTLACWVYLESKSPFENPAAIAKWDFTTNQRDYQLCFRNDSSQDRFQFLVSSDGSGLSAAASADTFGSPSNGTWYHVVAWHDSVNNLIGIAVNAGAADTTSYSSGVFDGTADFSVGANAQGASGSGNWDGLLAQAAIWKRVLTSDERTELYASGDGLPYADWDAGGGASVPMAIFRRPMRFFRQMR